MRVSSSMIYAAGTSAIQRQSADLLKTQQQLSTGRRVLTPSDDPVSSARALEVTQSKDVNTQFVENQGYAKDALALVEGKLAGVGDILTYMRTRAVEAGNPTYTQNERNAMAADLRSQFNALLGIANSQDGTGDYLFAGYKTDAAPFSLGIDQAVSYVGDDGERTVQVSASRYMPVGASGDALFMQTRSVDDAATAYNGTDNTGTGSLSATMSLPVNPADLGKRYAISYDGTNYQTIDLADNSVIATGASPTAPGMTLTVTGTPAAGDSFEVFVASDKVFDNINLFIDALENPGPSGTAGLTAFAIENLDAASENVLTTRAAIGSRLGEVEALEGLSGDLDTQYSQTLSRLQDLDYAEAISRFSLQQTVLQAAQQSYVKMTGLSLFDFLR